MSSLDNDMAQTQNGAAVAPVASKPVPGAREGQVLTGKQEHCMPMPQMSKLRWEIY